MSFVANPSRDAGPTIAGFFFQVNMSILRWLDLGPSQHLELEHGEDIDTVDTIASGAETTEKRLLEQLKVRSGQSLTLRSVEALEALANCCTHTHLNPAIQLQFRYLTTANIGFEKGWTGTQAAIATWQSIREGEYRDDARTEATELLRVFTDEFGFSPLWPNDYPIEIMALMSAHTCNSDADVDAWLEVVKQFSKTQLQVLALSELAEDNVVIVCDGVWSRELRKPPEERAWAQVKAKLERMEEVGRLIGFSLLEAAAIRARITVLAEFEAHVDDAMQSAT